jgi:nitrite reductase (NADH) small subunit
MPLEVVGPLGDLPDREGFLFQSGPYQIALFRAGDEVNAIDNECPHAGASLSMGSTDGETVACPWHCWEFNCRTGACISVEDYDVETYRVVIEAGIVKVELPE